VYKCIDSQYIYIIRIEQYFLATGIYKVLILLGQYSTSSFDFLQKVDHDAQCSKGLLGTSTPQYDRLLTFSPEDNSVCLRRLPPESGSVRPFQVDTGIIVSAAMDLLIRRVLFS
jgi:hypothetical protein